MWCCYEDQTPLHSLPKPVGVRVCLWRWSRGSEVADRGLLPPGSPQVRGCEPTGNHPSLHLPPSVSCYPLPSTFILLGIIDSVFFLHLIFSLLLFISFKPVLDRSRPSVCGEKGEGYTCPGQIYGGTRIHRFHVPPLLPSCTGENPVSGEHLHTKEWWIVDEENDRWMNETCLIFSWPCLHLALSSFWIPSPSPHSYSSFPAGPQTWFLCHALHDYY